MKTRVIWTKNEVFGHVPKLPLLNEDAEKKEREKKAKDECGKCPLCKSFHTFNSKKEKMFWPSDRLLSKTCHVRTEVTL